MRKSGVIYVNIHDWCRMLISKSLVSCVSMHRHQDSHLTGVVQFKAQLTIWTYDHPSYGLSKVPHFISTGWLTSVSDQHHDCFMHYCAVILLRHSICLTVCTVIFPADLSVQVATPVSASQPRPYSFLWWVGWVRLGEL